MKLNYIYISTARVVCSTLPVGWLCDYIFCVYYYWLNT